MTLILVPAFRPLFISGARKSASPNTGSARRSCLGDSHFDVAGQTRYVIRVEQVGRVVVGRKVERLVVPALLANVHKHRDVGLASGVLPQLQNAGPWPNQPDSNIEISAASLIPQPPGRQCRLGA